MVHSRDIMQRHKVQEEIYVEQNKGRCYNHQEETGRSKTQNTEPKSIWAEREWEPCGRTGEAYILCVPRCYESSQTAHVPCIKSGPRSPWPRLAVPVGKHGLIVQRRDGSTGQYKTIHYILCHQGSATRTECSHRKAWLNTCRHRNATGTFLSTTLLHSIFPLKNSN